MNVGTTFESKDNTFFEDIFPMRDTHSDPFPEPVTPMEFMKQSNAKKSDEDGGK